MIQDNDRKKQLIISYTLKLKILSFFYFYKVFFCLFLLYLEFFYTNFLYAMHDFLVIKNCKYLRSWIYIYYGYCPKNKFFFPGIDLLKDKMLHNSIWRDIKWDSSNKISWTAIPKDSIYLDNIRTIRFLWMIEGAI